MVGWVRDKRVTGSIIQPQYRISCLKLSMLLKKRMVFIIYAMRSGLKSIIVAYIELYVMVVLKDEEMETLDEEFHDLVDNVNDIVAEVMELPLYSFLGRSSPKTKKLWGCIGKTRVLVMIDSGATHNFISPFTVTKVQPKIEHMSKIQIKVGT